MVKRMKMVVNYVLLKIMRGVIFNTCKDSLVFRKNIAKTVRFFGQNNAIALLSDISYYMKHSSSYRPHLPLNNDPADAKQKSSGLLGKILTPIFI